MNLHAPPPVQLAWDLAKLRKPDSKCADCRQQQATLRFHYRLNNGEWHADHFCDGCAVDWFPVYHRHPYRSFYVDTVA